MPVEFNIKNAVAAVARELRLSPDSAVWLEAEPIHLDPEPSDPALAPCDCYRVRSRREGIVVFVHRNRETAEAAFQAVVESWIVTGRLLTEVPSSHWLALLSAATEACAMIDLDPWLTAKSREGWAAIPNAARRSRSEIVQKQIARLAEFTSDRLAAVLRLCDGDPRTALVVVIEQCHEFEPGCLARAVMKVLGGWEALSPCGTIAQCDEGFLIEADSATAAEHMARIFEEETGR